MGMVKGVTFLRVVRETSGFNYVEYLVFYGFKIEIWSRGLDCRCGGFVL